MSITSTAGTVIPFRVIALEAVGQQRNHLVAHLPWHSLSTRFQRLYIRTGWLCTAPREARRTLDIRSV